MVIKGPSRATSSFQSGRPWPLTFLHMELGSFYGRLYADDVTSNLWCLVSHEDSFLLWTKTTAFNHQFHYRVFGQLRKFLQMSGFIQRRWVHSIKTQMNDLWPWTASSETSCFPYLQARAVISSTENRQRDRTQVSFKIFSPESSSQVDSSSAGFCFSLRKRQICTTVFSPLNITI